MTEREIIEAELASVEEIRKEVKGKLEELTQYLGKMNVLHNVFSAQLKEDSSES